MLPETRCVRRWSASVGCQFLHELVECDVACFLEAAHAPLCFKADAVVRFNVDVMSGVVPCLPGCRVGLHEDVLAVFHGCTEAEVLDVKAEAAGTTVCVRDGVVDVELGIQEGKRGGARVAWAVEAITACCHANVMSFGLLVPCVACMIGAGHFAILGDGWFAHKKDGAGALDAVVLGALEPNAVWQELAPFISEAARPRGAGVAF